MSQVLWTVIFAILTVGMSKSATSELHNNIDSTKGSTENSIEYGQHDSKLDREDSKINFFVALAEILNITSFYISLYLPYEFRTDLRTWITIILSGLFIYAWYKFLIYRDLRRIDMMRAYYAHFIVQNPHANGQPHIPE